MAGMDDGAGRKAIKDWIEQQFGELDQKSYYQLLGIERSADERQIVNAYYHMVARFHPDNYVDALDADTRAKLVSLYSRLVEGYLVLRNPQKRSQYGKLVEQGKVRFTLAEERAPRKDPDSDVTNASARRFFKLGKAALAAGDGKGAIMNLKLALSVEPDNAAIQAEIARAETLMGGKGR
jgi:DnaJ-class molecular chaperone